MIKVLKCTDIYVCSSVGMVFSLAGGYAYALASSDRLTKKNGFVILLLCVPVCSVLLFMHWASQDMHKSSRYGSIVSRLSHAASFSRAVPPGQDVVKNK